MPEKKWSGGPEEDAGRQEGKTNFQGNMAPRRVRLGIAQTKEKLHLYNPMMSTTNDMVVARGGSQLGEPATMVTAIPRMWDDTSASAVRPANTFLFLQAAPTCTLNFSPLSQVLTMLGFRYHQAVLQS